MKSTLKVSLGGVFTALSVVIMLIGSFIPYIEIALSPIAALIIVLSVIELDGRWAFAIYFATSLVSLVLVSNKEPVLLYIFVFGYYPILKAKLESFKKPVVEYILKILVFNISITCVYVVLTKLFNLPLELTEDFGKYAAIIFYVLFNVIFVMFDFALTRLISAYVMIWQKQFQKFFKFKM